MPHLLWFDAFRNEVCNQSAKDLGVECLLIRNRVQPSLFQGVYDITFLHPMRMGKNMAVLLLYFTSPPFAIKNNQDSARLQEIRQCVGNLID